MSGKENPKLLSSYADKNSYHYIMDLRTGETFDFPFPPVTINERPNTPGYQADQILGRTSQIQTYTSNDNRSISFEVNIIDDYVKMPLLDVYNFLFSLQMPNVKDYSIIPPNVQLRLGPLVIRGVLSGINFTWSGPIRNGLRTILTANFEVKEARDIPLDGRQIRKGKHNV